MAVSTTPTRKPAAVQHCDACGALLKETYYTLVDRPERYCPTCIATRPRCDTCGAPLSTNAWRLHDGRNQCARCHRTAVYDLQTAQALYHETVEAVTAQLGLVLRIGVAFRLVDAPTLESIRTRSQTASPPRDQQTSSTQPYAPTLGLYQRQGHIRAIYMLYGLTRLLFRLTVAHEYAHAWQGENCPLLENTVLREGFAEWVAYRHLLWLGATRAAHRMRSSNHPYRPMLDHVLELEQRLGTAGLLHSMRTAE